jgi:hypothetical protein
MYKRVILFFAALSVAATCYPQSSSLKAISVGNIKDQIKYLASDSLQGRKTGSEGNTMAAEYIAGEATKIGLKPLPGQNSMFQPLSFQKISTVPDSTCVIVKDTTGKVIVRGGYSPFMIPSSPVSVSGDVVFLGYGYINSKTKYNDLQGVQINNKIIIVMTREPDLSGSGMPDENENVSEDTELRKLSSLIIMGPKAILYVADPAYGKSIAQSFSSAESYKLVPRFKHQGWDFSINVGVISAETANAILAGTGHDLAELQKRIAQTKAPVSFVLPDLKGELNVAVKKEDVESSNVVGYFEGSDSLLKNECVIYTAHYDHVGVDAAGDVFNGANDNASGSVGLLQVAKAFSVLNKKPARSIVFLWTTGEEEGLYGSFYYTSNPLFPLEKTVADINFDMIGRSKMPADTGKVRGEKLDVTGPDSIRLVSARDSKQFISIVTEAGKESKIYVIDDGKGLHFSGSDHYPFTQKGIPAVFFFTGLHRDYHGETDEYQFIDFNKIMKVSRTGFLTGLRVANLPGRLTIDNPSKN